ncbi:hypothetical protein ABPG75_010446 [Micractinium tetrahymenae]
MSLGLFPHSAGYNWIIAPVDSDDPIAKCLTSFELRLSAECEVTFTPHTSGGSFVEGLWSAQDLHAYPQYIECPQAPGAPARAASGSGEELEAVRGVVIAAFVSFVYGTDAWGRTKDIPVPDLDFQPGRLVVKRSGAPNLHYAITQSTISPDDILQDDDASQLVPVSQCSDLAHPSPAYDAAAYCLPNADSDQPCPPNSYPIDMVSDPYTTLAKTSAFRAPLFSALAALPAALACTQTSAGSAIPARPGLSPWLAARPVSCAHWEPIRTQKALGSALSVPPIRSPGSLAAPHACAASMGSLESALAATAAPSPPPQAPWSCL